MTNLREKALGYIRTNWGAPFILAFIVLLIASAALLSAGRSSTANSIAVYAFYALVLGVVLQIASYTRYGESEQEETTSYIPSNIAPPRGFRPGKRTLAVVVVAIVLIAGIGSGIYYKPSTTITTHTTTHTIGPLSAGVNFITTNPGPSNSVQLTIGINETGGVAPYNFTAYWSDGVNQTNDVGVFIRAILQNQSIPTSVRVVVNSADGQTAIVSVTIPNVNRNTTTSSSTVTETTTSPSTTSTLPSISFLESGLPSGTKWSVTLAGVAKSSATNQIVFNVPFGAYNYTLSQPYPSNFSRAYLTSPLSGTVTLSKASAQVTISYSTLIVGTPTNELFSLINKQTILLANGSEEFNATYVNIFPLQIQATVVLVVKNNTTGLIASQQDSTIAPLGGGGEQSTTLLLNGLRSGSYSVNLYAETASGVTLSQIVNSTITIS